MQYVYGALLLHAAGKEINEANLKSVLTAAGVTADATRIKALTASLDGVNIADAISTAHLMAAAPAAAGPAAGGPGGAGGKKEEKKEEEKVSEEEAAAGLGALFG